MSPTCLCVYIEDGAFPTALQTNWLESLAKVSKFELNDSLVMLRRKGFSFSSNILMTTLKGFRKRHFALHLPLKSITKTGSTKRYGLSSLQSRQDYDHMSS